MRIKEEIGRNYKTIDPSPIDFFHDNRVSVEIYPTYNQKFAASVEVASLDLRTPMQTFNTSAEADLWARNVYTEFVSKLNSLEESIYRRILSLDLILK